MSHPCRLGSLSNLQKITSRNIFKFSDDMVFFYMWPELWQSGQVASVILLSGALWPD